MKPLHNQVLADVRFCNDEFVDIEAVVVLRVGNCRHHTLADILRDPLPGELQIGERMIDLLAADQPRNKI